MPKSTLDKLLPIARIPDQNRGEWLESADQSVEILKDNLKADEVVIYASGPHMLIHSVLTPNELLDPPDHADLDRAYIMPDDSGSFSEHMVAVRGIAFICNHHWTTRAANRLLAAKSWCLYARLKASRTTSLR